MSKEMHYLIRPPRGALQSAIDQLTDRYSSDPVKLRLAIELRALSYVLESVPFTDEMIEKYRATVEHAHLSISLHEAAKERVE